MHWDNIDKKTFNKLFKQRNKNLVLIQVSLWEIAKMITSLNKGEEHTSHIWLEMNKKIKNVDKKNHNIFSYFWKIGLRELIRAKKIKLEPVETDRHTTNAIDYLPSPTNITRLPKFGTDAKRAIHKVIMRTKTALMTADTESEEYTYLSNGLDFIQEVNHEVWGEYVPLNVPTMEWQLKRKISKIPI